MDIDISHDSLVLLSRIYRAYLSRHESGISKSRAKFFGNISEALMPEQSADDVFESIRELHRAELVSATYESNEVICFRLTDRAIVYMENRVGSTLKSVIEFIASLI